MLATQVVAAPQHVARAERPLARPFAGVVTDSNPEQRLAALVRKTRVTGHSSMVLIDMSNGAIVESLNATRPMPPASVTKVATTLFAMNNLGPSFRFVTRVMATGPVQGGRVQGDLVLVGSGDPALDSDEMAQMIKDIRAQGITGVTGRFLVYNNQLPNLKEIDAGQPPNAGYNPGVSGLNLNFNRVYFEWNNEGGKLNLSLQGRAEGHSPRVKGIRIAASNRAGPVYKYSSKGGADNWSISAGALRKPGGVWLPVRRPSDYGAEVFRTLANHYGLKLPAPQTVSRTPAGTELARFTRRELKLVCRGMLHFSTNLTAEVLGLTASGQRSLLASGRAMSSWLAQTYGARSATFRDHSGLGESNRISAVDMAQIVSGAGRQGKLDGVLRRHFVASPGKKTPVAEDIEVRAKTGTLNFVRGLSGIIKGRKGKQFAFAIFSSDLAARSKVDGTVSRPPGTKTFSRRAVSLEQAVLADWIRRYAM